MPQKLDEITYSSQWFDSETSDYISIAGYTYDIPCEITGAPAEVYAWRKNGPVLGGGATMVFIGRDPGDFAVTFKLWTDQHHEIWARDLRPLLRTTVVLGKNGEVNGGKPLSIYHPVLADSDIGEACITSIGGKVRAGAGLYTVEIKFQHYMKPAPFKQTVVADGPLRDKDNVPTGAGTKYDQQAEALRATVAGLPPLGT